MIDQSIIDSAVSWAKGDPLFLWHFPKTQQLAYKLWEDSGRPDGRSLEFWTAAEKVLATLWPAK